MRYFTLALDSVERSLAKLDETLKLVPRRLTGGLSANRAYGNPALVDLKRRLEEIGRAMRNASPKVPVAALEAALLRRITEQLKAGQVAWAARLKAAPVAELYEEALDLVADIKELATDVAVRADTVMTGAGHAEAARTERRPFTARTETAKAEWHVEAKQLLLDGHDVTLKVGSLAAPAVHAWEGGRPILKSAPGMLPVEARLVLEKAVQISEIYQAIARHPDGAAQAASLHGWVERSRLLVSTPKVEDDRLPLEGRVAWSAPVTINLARVKADLLKLEPHGLIDPERAALLKGELAERLSAGL